jgi:hypothetical protein
MFRLIARLQVFVVFILAATLALHAQTARYSGRVTDPQGAAIPNAEVHLYNLDYATKVDTKTDASGNFVAP